MNTNRVFFTVIAFCFLISAAFAGKREYEYKRSDMRNITRLAIRILAANHYHRQPLDSAFSRRLFDNCFDYFDPEHIYFTQADVASLAMYRDNLHRHLMNGDFQFGFRLYELYRKRFAEYHDYAVKKLSEGKIDYNTNEYWIIDRKKVSRPANREEQLKLWNKKITHNALALRLAERRISSQKKNDSKQNEAERIAFKWELRTPEEKLISNLRDVGNSIEKRRPIDILGIYLDVLAGEFGSHSNYMAPAATEDFDISMKLSLSGIGATLSSEDGFIRVVNIVPKGPAGLSGKLFRDDRIVCAVQEDGSAANLLDLPVSRAVQHIRGERGTTVLLGVLSGTENKGGIAVDGTGKLLKLFSMMSGLPDYSSVVPTWRGKIVFKCVAIKRDKVKLDEFGAKGTVRTVKDSSGKLRKVGIIDLPSFYMDFDAVRRRERDARRGSSDVRRILSKFRRERVDSIVIDLRGNGGGSLPDAVELAGLFLSDETVVQIRNSNGEIEKLKDHFPITIYTGPMVVLTSKFSASASEIFAGAMRDHNRAILVGDSRTFGKGTVLTVEDISSHIRLTGKSIPAGTASFEIAMFFRATGSSVQQLGISTDILLPSLSQEMKVGEMFLDNHLPWSSIEPTKVGCYDVQIDKNIKILAEKSASRIAKNRDYIKFQRLINNYRRYRDRKQISLNEELRYKAYLTEVEVEKEAERLIAGEEGENKKSSDRDVVLAEAVNIAADYVSLFNKKESGKK